MTDLTICLLAYIAIGAVLFTLPDPGRTGLADFSWRRQGEIFQATLPDVLLWPLALWRRRAGSRAS